uniref:Winged helix Storkhead-box1 domain-containing protein n=1 Tax=Haemonchus contortus TaxID=6289 RepID=A0A7I4YKK8_HAECO
MSCLAITFIGPKTKNGRRLFENFVESNKSSFWNRELVEAVDSVIYMGFMRPSTLFVSGPQFHLQALRTAWARRVLKPAEGYSISSLGEMGAIQTVEQMQFVPLADVLCDAIVSLNRAGQATTIHAVRQHIIRNCAYVAPPSMDMVKQTVVNLIATGLVYKMGDHLFVSVPAQVEPKAKVAVECQTGMSIIAPEEPGRKDRFGFITRIFSKKQQQAKDAHPPSLPVKHAVDWNEKILAPTACRYQTTQRQTHHVTERIEHRRHPKCERIQITSSSECLDYGPIDPPECLPGKVEVIEDMHSRRKRRIKRKEIRTSTPVEASDSAYSVSPVQTDSNEEPGSWSEPDENKEHHTYMNLAATHDSTQFEEVPTIICPSGRQQYFPSL